MTVRQMPVAFAVGIQNCFPRRLARIRKGGRTRGEQAIPVLVATGVTRAAVLEEPGGVVPLPRRKERPARNLARRSECQAIAAGIKGIAVFHPTRRSRNRANADVWRPPVIGNSTADKGEPRCRPAGGTDGEDQHSAGQHPKRSARVEVGARPEVRDGVGRETVTWGRVSPSGDLPGSTDGVSANFQRRVSRGCPAPGRCRGRGRQDRALASAARGPDGSAGLHALSVLARALTMAFSIGSGK